MNQEVDRVTIEKVAGLALGKQVTLTVIHAGGSRRTVQCSHALNQQQIDWFHADSALNSLK
ncbi:hypothetical protein GW813_11570 [bacterium]|nr:hypothetical protein [bacterium]